GQQQADDGEAEADGQGGADRDVGDRDHHGRGQAEGDRLQAQDGGGHPAPGRALGVGGHLVVGGSGDLVAHRRPFSSERASPTVTTEPVTSTAPAPIETLMASPASASVAARSIASARSGTTLTRSSPKTSAAARPSAAADRERG